MLADFTGRITGLACPSIRVSVPYGFLTQRQEGTENHKIGVKVLQSKNNRCANVQFETS